MKSIYYWPRLSLLAFVMLAGALAACGPEAAPGGSEPGGKGGGASEVVAIPRELPKYEDEIVDLSNWPEPPAKEVGGIPPEDLTATPKTGGVVRVGGFTSGPREPHFLVSTGGSPESGVWAQGVLRWDIRCGCPQPALAESWTVSSDGLSYDFKLRKGVKFHNLPPVNGREVTVEDLKWSLDRVSGLAPRPGRQGSIFAARFANVKEFQVVDDRTLRMVMKQRDVQILAEIMYDYMIVMPKEAELDGAFSQVKAIIGTGPFMVEHGETGGNWRLKRNPDFWEKDAAGRQLPYLDAIETFQLDNTGRVASFKAKQIDWVAIQYNVALPLLGDPSVRYYSPRGLTSGVTGILMNVTKPPFNDVRARRALNLALDREEIINTVHDGPDGAALVNHLGNRSPWHWSEEKMKTLPGYAKTGPAKDKEIEEAKRLLAEAGFGSGLTLEMVGEGAPELLDVFRNQLAKVGIVLKTRTIPNNRLASVTRESGRVFSYMNQGGGHTPDYGVTCCFLPNSLQNASLYSNPEIEKLYLEERGERETEKRIALMDRIQQILWDDMPMAPVVRPTYLHAAYKNVRGWRNTWYDLYQSQGFQTAYMWLDK